eukprot:scaffold149_cov315-Pinguiococcus_pyrenoidosus.AAC.42
MLSILTSSEVLEQWRGGRDQPSIVRQIQDGIHDQLPGTMPRDFSASLRANELMVLALLLAEPHVLLSRPCAQRVRGRVLDQNKKIRILRRNIRVQRQLRQLFLQNSQRFASGSVWPSPEMKSVLHQSLLKHPDVFITSRSVCEVQQMHGGTGTAALERLKATRNLIPWQLFNSPATIDGPNCENEQQKRHMALWRVDVARCTT